MTDTLKISDMTPNPGALTGAELVEITAGGTTYSDTLTRIKAWLKTYFDTLYPSGSGTSTGTNTGDQTSVPGNAGTATALQTARNIGGVSFDGTANISLTAASINGLQGTGLTANDVGFRQVPQNSQSAAYTTVAADSAKHILHPSADTTARTFTIDSNANVAYPVGTAITIVNEHGAGVITIAITSDTMRLAGAGTTGSRTLAADGIATALKITSTSWLISGTNLT